MTSTAALAFAAIGMPYAARADGVATPCTTVAASADGTSSVAAACTAEKGQAGPYVRLRSSSATAHGYGDSGLGLRYRVLGTGRTVVTAAATTTLPLVNGTRSHEIDIALTQLVK